MSDDVTFTDEPWGSDDSGAPLLVRLCRSGGAGGGDDGERRPAILDVHGGAWTRHDRTLHDQSISRPLAAAGFVVAAIDFRQGPAHQHPAASRDVVAALAWLRDNAERLGIDPDRIGFLGDSSGGHLVMYAGITPNADHHRVGSSAEVIAPPRFIVALWPVSDPHFRYRYAKRVKRDDLIQAHDDFYVTEEAMRSASIPRVVVSGEAESLPPLLLVQAGEDANVPGEIQFDLMRAWQSRDGYLESSFFPGERHGFGLKEGPATCRMMDVVIDFARRHSRGSRD